MSHPPIDFPILCLARDSTISVVHTADQLQTCSDRGYKNGYYVGLVILDSYERAWEVISAERVSGVGPLGGWKLPFLSRKVRVELDMRKIEGVSLREIKEIIIRSIGNRADFWSSEFDLDVLISRVSGAESIKSLMGTFSE